MFTKAKPKLRTPKKLFWSLKMKKKVILGPQKMEKLIFFKKPEFCDLTEHWGLSRQLLW